MFLSRSKEGMFSFPHHIRTFLTWAELPSKQMNHKQRHFSFCTPKKSPKMNFVSYTIILRFAQTRYVWLFGCDLFSHWHITLKHVIYSSRTNGWAKIIGTRIRCDSKVAPYANIMNPVCHCTPFSSKCINSLFKYSSKHCSAK